MTDPITPPPELIKEWMSEFSGSLTCPGELALHTATRSAQWGADQELEACCEEMKSLPSPLGIPFGEMASNALRAARRPKMTDQHPLTDDIIRYDKKLGCQDFGTWIYTENDLRAAADWQLEQVMQFIAEEDTVYYDTPTLLADYIKQAMRPQEDQ